MNLKHFFFVNLLFLIFPMNLFAQEKPAIAIFAGGCFWCMQPAFDPINGVSKTIVGYTGGEKLYPTYQEVSAGNTGHVEAIEIYYDPKKITYKKLLDVFW